MDKLNDCSIEMSKLFIFCFFTLLELISFNSNNGVQLAITIAEYLFILCYILVDFRYGLFYFLAFTLLSLGQENFIDKTLPSSFWGLRMGPFSLNLWVTFFILIAGLLRDSLSFSGSYKNPLFKWYFYFFMYATLIGAILVYIGHNYLDDFVSDFFSFGCFFIYYIFFAFFSTKQVVEILKYSLMSTLFGLCLFYITGSKYSYGEGGDFLLSNSFWFIMPIVFFFTKDLFKPIYNYFFLLIILILLSGNFLFIGGKHIVLVLIISVFLLMRLSKVFGMITVCAFTFYFSSIFLWLIDYFSETVVSFKFSQIYNSLSDFDFELIALSKSSIGNIFAEARTLFTYLANNPRILFFGKGFGAGIPDLFGYLAPGAGNSAYAGIDLIRNNYHKMHLPLFEVVLKLGLIGLIFFVRTCVYYLNRSYRFWPFVVQLFFVFYVTKELMLVTILFLFYAELTDFRFEFKNKDFQ